MRVQLGQLAVPGNSLFWSGFGIRCLARSSGADAVSVFATTVRFEAVRVSLVQLGKDNNERINGAFSGIGANSNFA